MVEDVEVRRAATWAITRSGFPSVDLGDYSKMILQRPLETPLLLLQKAAWNLPKLPFRPWQQWRQRLETSFQATI